MTRRNPAAKRAWYVLPLVRLMVGAVFLSEGLQKFLFPALRGPARFEGMGWPYSEVVANVVGGAEIVAGILLLLGLYARVGATITATIMTVAIITTKVPIWMGEGFGPFEVRELGQYGFWSMAHAIRTDWAMLLGSIILLVTGAGPFSVDNWRGSRRRFRR